MIKLCTKTAAFLLVLATVFMLCACDISGSDGSENTPIHIADLELFINDFDDGNGNDVMFSYKNNSKYTISRLNIALKPKEFDEELFEAVFAEIKTAGADASANWDLTAVQIVAVAAAKSGMSDDKIIDLSREIVKESFKYFALISDDIPSGEISEESEFYALGYEELNDTSELSKLEITELSFRYIDASGEGHVVTYDYKSKKYSVSE